MQIHLARNNVSAGPYTLDELNTMLKSGEVELTDLMWHEGMDNWQCVGEMTGGQNFYNPSLTDHLVGEMQHTDQNTNTQNNDSPVADGPPHRRLTVAELYGQVPTQTPNAQADKPHPVSEERASAERGLPKWQGRHATPTQPHLLKQDKVVLASIGSRFLAFTINMVLFIMAMMPLQLAIVSSGIDPKTIETASIAQYQALGEQIAGSIATSSIFATFFMMVGLAIIQLLLLAKRGQSLGKLVVGIRIVDETSFKLADLVKVIVIRTLLLFVIYQIASMIFGLLAPILMAGNYILAKGNPTHKGWHDKISKTVVVKAHPAQLQK